MKTKKRNIGLRELFRQKLNDAQVIPDASVKLKLMRRVAGKEFLRFNPARFNIYYFGGILITGVTTAVLIFSAPVNSDRSNPSAMSEKLNKPDSGSYFEIPVGQSFNKETDNSNVRPRKSINNSIVFHLSDTLKTHIFEAPESLKISISVPRGINISSSRIGLSSKPAADKKNLLNESLADSVLIDPYVSAGCAPLKMQFYNKSTSFDSCRWNFGDGGYSNEKNPVWIFDVEGEYKVILQIFRHAEKPLISTATVTVYPRPKAKFEISPEKAVIPNDEIHFLNYSNNAVQFKWDLGDGTTSELFEPRHTYAKFGNYNVRLVAFSDLGCADSVVVNNAFPGSDYYIYFPNAFIPNAQGPSGGYYSTKSDNVAQVFHPSYSGVADYQLKIFSKLAILIFESNNVNIGWDGYNKGQLCEPGVYIWKVRGKFRNGAPFIRMGDVTLLKN